jgi:hypothetical protein
MENHSRFKVHGGDGIVRVFPTLEKAKSWVDSEEEKAASSQPAPTTVVIDLEQARKQIKDEADASWSKALEDVRKSQQDAASTVGELSSRAVLSRGNETLLASCLQEVAGVVAILAERIDALEKREYSITVNVPQMKAADVVVNVPELQAPSINVNVPETVQPAPVVNVQPAEVTVNVPEQATPVVNVRVPEPK